MKLKNKKTGKIQTCDMVVITDEKIDGEIASLNRHTFIFRSIEQFNDGYEAYKPKEPLIKDEKIRKAVKAWAEANDIVRAYVCNNEETNLNSRIYGMDIDRNKYMIEFFHRVAPDNLLETTFDIDELCGEEEE